MTYEGDKDTWQAQGDIETKRGMTYYWEDIDMYLAYILSLWPHVNGDDYIDAAFSAISVKVKVILGLVICI